MSVIRLLKDHTKHGKKGEVIDRVPFLEAKQLVVDGVAERQPPEGFDVAPKAAAVVAKPVEIDPNFNRLEDPKDTKKGVK
jgi:hypothetical protein